MPWISGTRCISGTAMQVQHSSTAALSQTVTRRGQRRRRLDAAPRRRARAAAARAAAARAAPSEQRHGPCASKRAAPAEGLDQEGGAEGHAALPHRLPRRGDADGQPRADGKPAADQRDERREDRPAPTSPRRRTAGRTARGSRPDASATQPPNAAAAPSATTRMPTRSTTGHRDAADREPDQPGRVDQRDGAARPAEFLLERDEEDRQAR